MSEMFAMALLALEEAHESLIRSYRSHAANLMAYGLTPGEVEPNLAEIDELESSLKNLRQALRGEAEL